MNNNNKKNLIVSSLFLLSLASMNSLHSSALAGSYEIDPSHSSIAFTVRHLVGNVKGQFTEFQSSFSFDQNNPDKAKVTVQINANSINTNDKKRDDHLKGEDFFNVAKHKTLRFVGTKLVPVNNTNGSSVKKYQLTGDLSLHGITRPITLDVVLQGEAKDPWGNQRIGFTATTQINREDFGMKWNKVLDQGGMLIGNEVSIDLNIEAVEKK